jgi:Ca2+-binding EF-hand superfamily protein
MRRFVTTLPGLSVQVPADFHDLTHFPIELYFEDNATVVHVPNPQVLRKRCCALWPDEVKQALGFMGNMQELWIEPVALVPRNMPKLLSQPIPFEPSVRLGGQLLINATKLKSEQAYDVTCEDRRDEALNSLTTEEMDAIKATFQQCDLNGDGGISRVEMSELVRRRTTERKAIIDEKFEDFLAEPGITRDDVASAEANKATLMQSLSEAQNKLLKMFEAADTNGDGVISFTEFIMAEAWWMRCTINPERAHLF